LPFKDPAPSLNDNLSSIDLIESFTSGMNLESFRNDAKTIAAVERKLLSISEAAVRLGDEAERLCPGMRWRDIRGIGNWLRHQHDRIDVEIVWNTATEHLPELKRAAS
jgi:uncharacterized protein with HEPN domain